VSSDGGVARERTVLAWDRTALAIVAGAVVVTRLTYDRLGAGALACLVVALPLAVLAGAVNRRRASSTDRDGLAPAAVAAATVAMAAVELWAVLG
jgi:uncharacterized membrane protein YidH (DUF202 family)